MWQRQHFCIQYLNVDPRLARLDGPGTSHFLLPLVVNSVFVTCKIVWLRKGQVAKLAHDWVYALTFVRTRLRVAESLCWSVAALTVT
jgi:hypothetical protein